MPFLPIVKVCTRQFTCLATSLNWVKFFLLICEGATNSCCQFAFTDFSNRLWVKWKRQIWKCWSYRGYCRISSCCSCCWLSFLAKPIVINCKSLFLLVGKILFHFAYIPINRGDNFIEKKFLPLLVKLAAYIKKTQHTHVQLYVSENSVNIGVEVDDTTVGLSETKFWAAWRFKI